MFGLIKNIMPILRVLYKNLSRAHAIKGRTSKFLTIYAQKLRKSLCFGVKTVSSMIAEPNFFNQGFPKKNLTANKHAEISNSIGSLKGNTKSEKFNNLVVSLQRIFFIGKPCFLIC